PPLALLGKAQLPELGADGKVVQHVPGVLVRRVLVGRRHLLQGWLGVGEAVRARPALLSQELVYLCVDATPAHEAQNVVLDELGRGLLVLARADDGLRQRMCVSLHPVRRERALAPSPRPAAGTRERYLLCLEPVLETSW